jgi:hypothetical protein
MNKSHIAMVLIHDDNLVFAYTPTSHDIPLQHWSLYAQQSTSTAAETGPSVPSRGLGTILWTTDVTMLTKVSSSHPSTSYMQNLEEEGIWLKPILNCRFSRLVACDEPMFRAICLPLDLLESTGLCPVKY